MNQTKLQGREPEADEFAPRRFPVRLPAARLALVVAGIAVTMWAIKRGGADQVLAAEPPATPAPSAPAPAPTTGPTATPATAPSFPAELRQHVVGRWVRPDGGYILTIQTVGEDGKVTATYANPNPIKVSRALLASKDGQTLLFVELRDKGYPGNFYVLSYDPAKDQLTGVYNHLGINQQFEVFFQRLPKEAAGKE